MLQELQESAMPIPEGDLGDTIFGNIYSSYVRSPFWRPWRDLGPVGEEKFCAGNGQMGWFLWFLRMKGFFLWMISISCLYDFYMISLWFLYDFYGCWTVWMFWDVGCWKKGIFRTQTETGRFNPARRGTNCPGATDELQGHRQMRWVGHTKCNVHVFNIDVNITKIN